MRSRWIVFVAAAGVAGVALGQADDWYPSPWGPADQRGAANRITPAKVLEAKSLMTRGTVYQLGQRLRGGDAAVRHASLQLADSADVRAARLESDDVSRRDRERRDRPSRHAVRRLGPHRRRRSVLQRQRPRRVLEGRRAHEARRRERRRARDARRARRRRGVQGRRAARRRLRDHARRSAQARSSGSAWRFAPATSSSCTRVGARSGTSTTRRSARARPASAWRRRSISSSARSCSSARTRGRRRSCRIRIRSSRFPCTSC